jgi:uncharacterized protein
LHFLDTTVLVGGADRRDELHQDAKSILQALPQRRWGQALVSELVLSETATILSKRRGPQEAAAYVAAFLDSANVRCVFLDVGLFQASLKILRKHGERLSFTDAATVAIMESFGCKLLFSHDGGFDGVPNVTRRTRID